LAFSALRETERDLTYGLKSCLGCALTEYVRSELEEREREGE